MAQRASRSIRFNAEHADDTGPEKVLNELFFFPVHNPFTRGRFAVQKLALYRGSVC